MTPMEKTVLARFHKHYGPPLAALFSRDVDMTHAQRAKLSRRLAKAFRAEWDRLVIERSRRGPGRQPQVSASSF